MNRLVVTNVFGPLNRGDHELVGALLRQIGPGWRVAGIARQPDLCSEHFPDHRWLAQPGRRDEKLGPLPPQVVRLCYTVAFLVAVRFPLACRLLPRAQREAPRAIRDADLVVACPGGYLHDDSWSFFLQVSQVLAARIAGKPLVAAPMSIGPLRTRLSRRLVALALQNAQALYVRDDESVDLASDLGLRPLLHVDLAVEDLQGKENTVLDPDPYVLCTLLRFAFPDESDAVAAKQLYEDRAVEALSLLAERGYGIKLMVQVDGDLEVIERVNDRLSGRSKIVYPRDPDECRDLMRRATGVLASRLHSGIFALQVGAPVIFLGYQPKSAGVLRTLGLEDLVRPLTDFDPVELVGSLNDLMADRGDFEMRVQMAIRELPASMTEFGATIRSGLKGKRDG